MIHSYLRTLYRPDVFHGHGKSKKFFEGWFFKVVDPDGEHVYSFIPGIFLGQKRNDAHSFIQIMNGKTGETFYHRYTKNEFSASRKTFDVQIATNRFNSEKIILDISREDQIVHGTLKFLNTTPWPVTFLSPGTMGWYSYVPFMECNHGVVSLYHDLDGELTIDSKKIDFTGGRGYIEKDWGKSFPEAWIWIQSNHFETPRTSIVASVAKIPWMFSSFRGFIIGFYHNDTLYRFATYTGAKITQLKLIEEYVSLIVQDKKYRLTIKTKRGKTGMLYSPHRIDMMERTAESLDAITEVHLTDISSGKIIFEGTGKHSGLDINGKIKEIMDGIDQ
jgi:tocopherol cyclase